MLATQMQVLNSESSFLRGTSGQTLCSPWLRHVAKLGGGVLQGLPEVQGTETQAQSKLQE